MSRRTIELAPMVEAPRWVCRFGTVYAVVVAETESDARAIVRERVRKRNVPHRWWEIKVRRLRVSDEHAIAGWEARWAEYHPDEKKPKSGRGLWGRI